MTDKEKLTQAAKELGEKARDKAKSAASDATEAVRGAVKDEKGDWSTGAKVGAAVGSAAIAAALIYAGRHQMKKHDDFKAAKINPATRFENEPVFDEDEDDLADDNYGSDEEE